MRASASHQEVEIKLRVAGASIARRLLRVSDFRVVKRRVLEDNWVLDTPGQTLRRAGSLLRVRQAGKAGTLTYKAPASSGRHKSREEFEIEISDARAAARILEHLGFRPSFRYQKYRTEYALPGVRGVVMLDETPVGCYLEIEGAPRWIDRTARRLGFREADYITTSYAGLYFAFCEAQGATPGDMIFARTKRSGRDTGAARPT